LNRCRVCQKESKIKMMSTSRKMSTRKRTRTRRRGSAAFKRPASFS
jgi:hypothetical protein